MSGNLAAALRGASFFTDSRGSTATYEELGLANCAVIGLYFSAHWCPPCRQFTPMLKQAYQMSDKAKDKSKFRMIFVSGDRSVMEQMDYMRESHHPDWIAVPAQSQLARNLNAHYGVRGIPNFTVVKGGEGTVISSNGREEIMRRGSGALDNWIDSNAPVAVDTSVVLKLRDNDPEVKVKAAKVLLKLLDNVIRDPSNLKFRQLKLTNERVQNELLPADGAFEILFSVGFEEGDDSLTLPMDADIRVLAQFAEAIRNLDSQSPSKASSSSLSASSSTSSSASLASNSAPPSRERGAPTSAINSKIQVTFMALVKQAVSWEDRAAKLQAVRAVPMSNLQAKVDKMVKDAGSPVTDPEKRDLLLLALLDWFKNEFFSWMDQPECDVCLIKTVQKGMAVKTSQEDADGADRVELYVCPKCKREYRFPRYHRKPARLLETKSGRCGEWANCFGLISTALNFDTRIVNDNLDHVWLEVYSVHQSRWLHVDPCENACDRPWTYEKGWNKTFTVIQAASKSAVQDVTWRYVQNHNDLKTRRRIQGLDSKEHQKVILAMNESLANNVPPGQKQLLLKRRIHEIVSFLCPPSGIMPSPQSDSGEYEGRQSGSLAWRTARGETRDNNVINTGHCWEIDVKNVKEQEEEKMRKARLQYDVVQDFYMFCCGDSCVIKKTWKEGIFQGKNILRKEESDWKMAYLARQNGEEPGELTWTFRLSETGHKKLKVLVESKTFENGHVKWEFFDENNATEELQPGKELETTKFKGSKVLTIRATLTGGRGDVAWQHAQLFRASMAKDAEDIQDVFNVTFEY